jgi:hypothetical protein
MKIEKSFRLGFVIGNLFSLDLIIFGLKNRLKKVDLLIKVDCSVILFLTADKYFSFQRERE